MSFKVIKLSCITNEDTSESKTNTGNFNYIYECCLCHRQYFNLNSMHKHMETHMKKEITELSNESENDDNENSKDSSENKKETIKAHFESSNNYKLRKKDKNQENTKITKEKTNKTTNKNKHTNTTHKIKKEKRKRSKLHNECHVCHKKLPPAALERHLRTHTGEKPFQCQLCLTKFQTSFNVVRHMRIHTGERPYDCSQCGKKFSQSYILKEHMRIHTGIPRPPRANKHNQRNF